MDGAAMICSKCARENPTDATFCTQCGSPLRDTDRAVATRGMWASSSRAKPGWRTYDDIPVSPLARKVAFALVGIIVVVGLILFTRGGGAPSSILSPIDNVGDGTCVHTPAPHATSADRTWICRNGHWVAQH